MLLVRNGEQLLLALVIPVGHPGRSAGSSAAAFGDLDVLAPSVLALAVWSSAFTSVAIATGFERRYGVLERLACTPLGRGGSAGRQGAGHRRDRARPVGDLRGGPGAGLAARLTVWAARGGRVLLAGRFAGLALALAGRLRAEADPGLANVIYVVLLAGGALVAAADRYPGASCNPSSPCCRPPRSAKVCGRTPSGGVLGWPLLVLVVWAGSGCWPAWKGFRWTS